MFNKLPPQNIDAEESIIASILQSVFSPDEILELLNPDDFYRTAHQKIFKTISEMAISGLRVDLVSLAEELKKKNQLDEIGGAVYLAKLVDTAPIVPNMEQYAGIIKGYSIKRQIIKEASIAADQCYDNTVNGIEILDATQNNLSAIKVDEFEDQPVLAGGFCNDRIDHYEKVNNSKTGITGIETKFKKLDKITGGLQPTDLIILAARPGMGKTAFALDLGLAITQQKKPALFESLEMANPQLVDRLAAKISGINSEKLRTGGINSQEWYKLTDAMDQISVLPFYIDSPKNCEFNSIIRKIKKQHRENKIEIVLIDYLQLMFCKGDFSRKDLEIADMTRKLKQLAKDLNIPVVLLSQLNRGVENRTDKRPVLSDLRESGAIEQDADIILFLYRDEEYNKEENNPNKGKGELIIAKHRNGRTGMIPLVFQGTTATYRNYISDPTPYRPPYND